MRIFLTGATGLIGTEVCRFLLEQGHDLVATDLRPVAGTPVPIQCCDLLDLTSVYPWMEGCEAVVHFGNHANLHRRYPPQRLFTENVTMTAHVFQAAIDLGIRRIITASSIQAICGTRMGDAERTQASVLPYLPLDSGTPSNPGNLYALSKCTAEHMLAFYAAQDKELSATALRLPFISRHGLASRAGFRIPIGPGNLDEALTYLDVTDVGPLVHGVLVANRKEFRAIHPSASVNRIGWTVAECMARFYPSVPLRKPIEGTSALVDLDELKQLYGWQPSVVTDFPPWKVGMPSPHGMFF